MRQKQAVKKQSAEKTVRDIRRATRRQYSAEDEDPHRAGRLTWVGEHCGAVPQRRHQPESLLPLIEGTPRGAQATPGRRHGP